MTSQAVPPRARRWAAGWTVAALTVVWLAATPAVFLATLFLGLPPQDPGWRSHGLFHMTAEDQAGLDATYGALHRALIAFAASAVLGPVLIAGVAAVTRLRKTAAGYAVLAALIGLALAYVAHNLTA